MSRVMRRVISSRSASLNAPGARRSVLSMLSVTSAKLRAGRVFAPAKITSSMPSPRMDLAEVSPMTQRKRFEKVGLAAAVRADYRGEARANVQLRRIDEGFEPGKPKFGEMHAEPSALLGARGLTMRAIPLDAGTAPTLSIRRVRPRSSGGDPNHASRLMRRAICRAICGAICRPNCRANSGAPPAISAVVHPSSLLSITVRISSRPTFPRTGSPLTRK